jgi:hypothetical protein
MGWVAQSLSRTERARFHSGRENDGTSLYYKRLKLCPAVLAAQNCPPDFWDLRLVAAGQMAGSQPGQVGAFN